MDTDRRERIQVRTEELLAALPLSELRKARELSQEEMGDLLDVNQATVSKMERRADMYVSTMRRFLEAMGGKLEIRARFPEGVVEIDQFGAIPLASAPASYTPASAKEGTVAHKKTTGKKAGKASSKTLKSKATGKASKSAAGSSLSQSKAPKKATGTKAASAASKTLSDKRTSKASKSAAGSALSQRHESNKKGSKGGAKKK